MRLKDTERDLMRRWGQWFHQDIDVLYESWAEVVQDSEENFSHAQAEELADLFERLLENCTNSELNGHWNRSGTDWHIKTKDVRKIFELTKDALSKKQ